MPVHSQFRAPSLQRYIDYYFEVGLYLLVLTGFGMLAATGGVDLPSRVLVATAMVIRGYLLAKRRKVAISDGWTTPLSIAYFIFFALDYFAFSHSFLPATIHLALFGVVVRMFSIRRDRDNIMLAILAFLMVLSSAILTVDSLFFFGFAAFMLVAIATFMLFEMRRSGHAAHIQARHSSDPQEHRHLAFALARIAPALAGVIVIFSAALFFVMPRISAGYLGAYSYGTDLSTGFSDRVELGQIGAIQQSNSVVMHVQIDGDTIGRYDLHWRGVALSYFDGSTWSSPRGRFPLQPGPDNRYTVPYAVPTSKSDVTRNQTRANLIHYRVLMEPIGTNVFFLAPWAQNISGDYRLLSVDPTAAVFNQDPSRTISRYEAISDIAVPSPAELRAAGHNDSSPLARRYLQLPPIDPRVVRLAEQIADKSRSDFDKAFAIETYLKTHFGYTLELPRTTPKDPIANFLFERKRGHCEYFASSMAVMLRALGIPSRVVNGFHTDEFNDLTGKYIIRAKDAHSWVEAYFPGYGWQMFDPTPAGRGGSAQTMGRIAVYLDAMASFWRDWVVSYDTTHQLVLGQTALNSTRGLWERSRIWAHKKYHSMLRWARRNQNLVEHSPIRWILFGLGAALLILLLANLGRLARWSHERWLRAHPESSPEQAAAMWYQRMARVLAKHGVKRSTTQTPHELLQNIKDGRLREPVSRFTGVYESARFGNSIEDAQRLPELYEEVETATKAK